MALCFSIAGQRRDRDHHVHNQNALHRNKAEIVTPQWIAVITLFLCSLQIIPQQGAFPCFSSLHINSSLFPSGARRRGEGEKHREKSNLDNASVPWGVCLCLSGCGSTSAWLLWVSTCRPLCCPRACRESCSSSAPVPLVVLPEGISN